VADNIEDDHDHHEPDAKAKRHAPDQILDRRAAFISGPHAAATRHGVTLAGEDHQAGEKKRREKRQAKQNVKRGQHEFKILPQGTAVRCVIEATGHNPTLGISLPPRVLLVARDMLGDLVNTTGAVRSLVQAFPGTEFVLEGGMAAGELGFPVGQVLTRPRGGGLAERWRRVRRWRKFGLGCCVVLDDGHTHARLARLAGIRQVYGIHRGKPDLFNGSVAFDESGHDLFDQVGPLLKMLGVENADARPVLMPSEADRVRAREIFEQLGRPEVLIHPGASDVKKTWPDETWAALIDLLKEYRLAAIGGPGEDAERFGIPSPAEPLRVLEYAALLESAAALVTPDTGPAHVAAAMGTPTVVLYGPTDPRRFHPWDNGNQALLYEDKECRHYGSGCAHLQNGACPRLCTQAIKPEMVVAALRKVKRDGTQSPDIS
jgi:ADP-heptose:LPS heptosyltransferase